jgi:hypothetical protein
MHYFFSGEMKIPESTNTDTSATSGAGTDATSGTGTTDANQ